MNKPVLLALACSALAGSAFAQTSSVTLFGVVDELPLVEHHHDLAAFNLLDLPGEEIADARRELDRKSVV